MNCILCKSELQGGKFNYIVDLEEGVIIVKNVPANVCKQCGEYFIDTNTMLKLKYIVEEVRKNRAEVFIVNYNINVPGTPRTLSNDDKVLISLGQ